MESIINSKNTLIFIAEEQKKIVATMTLVLNKIPTGNKVWLEDVVVNKSMREKGVGKKTY